MITQEIEKVKEKITTQRLESGDWIVNGRRFSNLEIFITRYFPHYLTKSTPAFLREIYSLLLKHRRLVFGGARELAKTMAVCVFYPSYCLTRSPDDPHYKGHIILISKTATMSEDSLSIISNEFLNNQLLKSEFPHLYPLQAVSKDTLKFATGQKVVAKGKDYQIRGAISTEGRPDLIVVDDPEETVDVESETSRRTLEDWFDRSVSNAVTGEGQLVLMGNIISALCFVYKVIHSENKYLDFIKKTYPIMVNNQSIWPDLWPMERIQAKRDSIGYRAFQSDYMCQPVQPEQALFHQEWIQFYKTLPENTTFDFIAGVDPAGFVEGGSIRKRDYWGLCIGAKALNGEFKDHIFIVGLYRFRLPDESAITKLFDICRPFRPEINIEQSGMTQLSGKFQRIQEHLGLYMTCRRVVHTRTSGDLFARMIRLTGMFETNKVHFKKEHTNLLDQELLPYPIVEHDDSVSALEIMLTRALEKRMAQQRQVVYNPLIQRYGLQPDEVTGLLR